MFTSSPMVKEETLVDPFLILAVTMLNDVFDDIFEGVFAVNFKNRYKVSELSYFCRARSSTERLRPGRIRGVPHRLVRNGA